MSCIDQVTLDLAKLAAPPERLTVPQSAEKFRVIRNSQGYNIPWENAQVPYLEEPMRILTSRHFNACIFMAPAQTGKTEMILNLAAHIAKCMPMDMMIIEATAKKGRDFTLLRVDRMLANSPELKKLINLGTNKDNVGDKIFKAGNMLKITHPSINELSGRPIPIVAITDYDRMDDDVGGEGTVFDQAQKRTTTFGSRAMTLCESSPGRVWLHQAWKPSTPHEAPYATGIASLYNRGDRRKLYTQCFSCNEYFCFDFQYLEWESSDVVSESAESVTLRCPHCARKHEPKLKNQLKAASLWLKDHQTIDANGKIKGDGPGGTIASFWMQGPAANFQTWENLVEKFLLAKREYDATGEEKALKSTAGLDQGVPYKQRLAKGQRSADQLQARATKTTRGIVLKGIRFLFATVDVQKNKFVVQVHGIGIDLQSWIVDRYDITESNRYDHENKRCLIDPAAYAEDWDTLIPALQRRYLLDDNTGRSMGILRMACDSGGKAGVTDNAYSFYRRNKKKLGDRLLFVKGNSSKQADRVRLSYPDTAHRKKTAEKKASAAKGDIPVLLINSNQVKDAINTDLARPEPGPGYVNLPDWLPDTFFAELSAETKTTRGWVNAKSVPNEAFDLLYYCKGLLFHYKVDKINWSRPPNWAEDWHGNPMISGYSKTKSEERDQLLRTKARKRRFSKGVFK